MKRDRNRRASEANRRRSRKFLRRKACDEGFTCLVRPNSKGALGRKAGGKPARCPPSKTTKSRCPPNPNRRPPARRRTFPHSLRHSHRQGDLLLRTGPSGVPDASRRPHQSQEGRQSPQRAPDLRHGSPSSLASFGRFCFSGGLGRSKGLVAAREGGEKRSKRPAGEQSRHHLFFSPASEGESADWKTSAPLVVVRRRRRRRQHCGFAPFDRRSGHRNLNSCRRRTPGAAGVTSRTSCCLAASRLGEAGGASTGNGRG